MTAYHSHTNTNLIKSCMRGAAQATFVMDSSILLRIADMR